MILTLTTNAALDRIIFIDEFRPGAVMRPERMIDRMGGKGLCASVALRTMAVDTLGISFVAGDIGQRLMRLLDGYGVRHDLVWLPGETRLAHVLAEQKRQRHSHVIVGNLPVTAEAVADFLRRYQTHLPQADWVVAAGSLPPGAPADFYQTVVEMAHKAGKSILIDGTGPPIRSMLPARPTILKMNWTEFNHTFERATDTLGALQYHAQIVYKQERLTHLVLTCEARGILALTPEGTYLAAAPAQQVVNAAGAGDAASGTLAWRQAKGDSFPKALRWAAAVSAAVVLTEGTADCNLADIERLLPETTVEQR